MLFAIKNPILESSHLPWRGLNGISFLSKRSGTYSLSWSGAVIRRMSALTSVDAIPGDRFTSGAAIGLALKDLAALARTRLSFVWSGHATQAAARPASWEPTLASFARWAFF